MAGPGGHGVQTQSLPTADTSFSVPKHLIGPNNGTLKTDSDHDDLLPQDEPMSSQISATTTSYPEMNPRKVVTGLPRAQTFKRRLSEQRAYLEPTLRNSDERRAASADVPMSETGSKTNSADIDPRSSSFRLLTSSTDGNVGYYHTPHLSSDDGNYELSNSGAKDTLCSPLNMVKNEGALPMSDAASLSASRYDTMIADELENKWILNLSMHFRDRSKREKFFVTYREGNRTWRRVTISLDYRNAPANSLETELIQSRSQRDKIFKIYEAIRESLQEIQFYDTVTNLKLETTEGRLHVHVVEDGNEIIQYPKRERIHHLSCRRVRESEITFVSHMSGFVYKVKVHGRTLIKKEIPSPDTIEEFLYEVNALSSLKDSTSVVQLYGVVMDDFGEEVKGLLIEYAEKGALIDIIYDNCREQQTAIPWHKRQNWARQIVQGLADIHEVGYVQGDLTLSNVVVDAQDNAKIIDINRRGCPVGWEPPEAMPLIKTHHSLTLYTGVKSDLFQLGMVLWGLAMLEDEPETHGRPLVLGPEINVPDWYRQVTEFCLSTDPRLRLQASELLQLFPSNTEQGAKSIAFGYDALSFDRVNVGDSIERQSHIVRTVELSDGWRSAGTDYVDTTSEICDPFSPMRGRSPPSPLTSAVDPCDLPGQLWSSTSWAANKSVRPSYSDDAEDDATQEDDARTAASRVVLPLGSGKHDTDSAVYIGADLNPEKISPGPAAPASAERKRSLGDGLQSLSNPKLSGQDEAIPVPARLSQFSSHERDNVKFFDDEDPEPIADSKDGGAGIDGVQTMPSDRDGGASLQVDHESPFPHQDTIPGQADAFLKAVEARDEKFDAIVDSSQVLTAVGSQRLTDGAVSRGRIYAFHDLRNAARGTSPDNGGAIWKERDPFVKEMRRRADDSRSFRRRSSLPASLAGMGTGKNFKDGSETRDNTEVDDDDRSLKRPSTMPTHIATTRDRM